MLLKNPGFTAVAVLTLALGIGGTTAIFSIIQGAVLNPFPYRDSHRLAVLVSRDTREGQGYARAGVSASEFLDYEEQNRVFDGLIGETPESILLTGIDAPRSFFGARVTSNFFRVLGVPPLIGRSITPEDCRPGAPPVAVLSHKVWQSNFNGDPGIVGRSLILNQRPTTVIGVMPRRFAWQGYDLWLPATLSRSKATDQPQYFELIGYLKPGVSIEQAAADVGVLSRRFASVYPKDHPKQVSFWVESLADSDFGTNESRKTLYIILGAVSLLLLIGCVNIANLLLARATAREKEIAIRAALGASRGRLVRQFLIESLLLALGGAVLGCVFAWNGLDALVAIIPEWYMPAEAVIRINGPVLLFTLGAALCTTLLFGLAPALLAVRRNLQEPLKESGRGAGESRGHSRLRNLLVVGEVGLSLVLLTGAGLLIRSFFALRYADLGYNPDNVMRAGAMLPKDRYKTAEQRNQFYTESLRRVRALPGVVSAALSCPPMHWAFPCPIEIAGKPGAENRSVWLIFSSDRFFETMGIRLLQGRTISEEDFLKARKVVVVNRAFVSKYFEGENPLGHEIKMTELQFGFSTFPQGWFEIVGEVADTRHRGVTDPTPTVEPTLFVPYTVGGPGVLGLLVRTAAEPTRLLNSVRRELAAIDPELPVEASGKTLQDELQQDWFTEPRFVLTMLVAFASLGLVLVSVGVYSVLSYAVTRRTQEIGIRMALGADATDVRRMVIMSGLRWLLVGIGIGVPTSIALAKILQNRIWGIKSVDPLTLVAVSLVLTAVGLAACYFPARRATKVDPMVALRYE